jgi:hypothetical protein
VNKLVNYLSITDALKKENICQTLHFISVLITAIGYYGDQNDGEESKTIENISNTSEVVGDYLGMLSILLFILAMLCTS